MDIIKRLSDLFAKFPTVGPRMAGRFVFYLISQPKEKIDELVAVLQELKHNVKLCAFCFNPHELAGGLCPFCSDNSRNKELLCVIEKENDLLPIEATKRYKGLYFILGGVLGFRTSAEDLRIASLQKRLGTANQFKEIIIALNPTPEGKATSVLVQRAIKELSTLKPSTFKLTHLAQGLPVGGELEYADEETLESAFEGRK